MVRHGFIALALASALGLSAACSGGGPVWQGGGGASAPPKGPQLSAQVTEPAPDATNVPASTGITFTTKNATDSTIKVADNAGNEVKGKLVSAGSWMPDGALDYDTTYTVTVDMTAADGKTATATSTFTTMPRPANQVRVSSFLGDGSVVGVGMPLIIKFSRAIPEKYRAGVQKRLTVRSDPPQEGIWRWISPTEVHFRPKTFWKAGTKIHYKAQTGGLPMGDGWYGRSDFTVDMSIGSRVIMTVDNATKKMTVVKDGKLLRTILVSLGKASTPSSSGTMVVIDKKRKTIFDTYAELGPVDGYRTEIEYAQRLTWGGEFIHAAPWSVADQGHRNVSHGCVNMSMSNAEWLFNITKVGDPVIVKGTERKLQNGNGWTDWNMSWSQYVKGSALPYQPQASADASASPGN